MFQVGDYIVYGVNGVCVVDKVGTVNVSGIPKDKLFYTLVPVYSKGSKVFTPTDNEKVVMRPVISIDDALAIIDEIKNADYLWDENDRVREQIYKESMKKCDCREWVRIIKTLRHQKAVRASQGKKMSASDEKYLHMAKDNLLGELAIPFQKTKEDVDSFIQDRLKLS